MPTFTDAYSDGGYVLRNPRNQWFARKEDGSRVAVTIWSDQISKGDEPWIWDLRTDPDLEKWSSKQGNTIRSKDVAWAIKHHGGEVDLILCVAEDPSQEPRKVKTARFWKQRIGRIDVASFDERVGTFRMELHPA